MPCATSLDLSCDVNQEGALHRTRYPAAAMLVLRKEFSQRGATEAQNGYASQELSPRFAPPKLTNVM